MRHVHNILFGIAFAFLLVSAMAANIAVSAGAELPAWASPLEDVTYLESRPLAKMPSLTPETISNCDFQEGIEDFLSDNFPDRENVIMNTASFQRVFISPMAALCGFDAYSTYYGSNYAYLPNTDQIVPFQTETKDVDLDLMSDVATKLNEFSASGIVSGKTVFCSVPSAISSDGNPTSKYRHGVLDEQFIQDNLISKLNGVDMCVLDHTSDTFLKEYYRSDHHWRVLGGYHAYTKTLEKVAPGQEPVSYMGVKLLDDVNAHGTATRNGRMKLLTPEHIDDLIYTPSQFEIKIDGEPKTMEDLVRTEMYANGDYNDDELTARYDEYYHTNYQCIEIVNRNAPIRKTLCLVGDSYFNSIERFYAENYYRVYKVDPRISEFTLSTFAKKNGVDDVIFMCRYNTYCDDDRFAKFLEL